MCFLASLKEQDILVVETADHDLNMNNIPELTGLFLGAGFSYEVGMPLVWELTSELKETLTALSGGNIFIYLKQMFVYGIFCPIDL
jgi:hypothetical protein